MSEQHRAALAAFLGAEECDIEDSHHNPYGHGCGFEYGDAVWVVLSSFEYDWAAEQCLDQYIDDIVLPELPEHYRQYFDRARFARDAECSGDLGSLLDGYGDGIHEQLLDGEWFYIVRVD